MTPNLRLFVFYFFSIHTICYSANKSLPDVLEVEVGYGMPIKSFNVQVRDKIYGIYIDDVYIQDLKKGDECILNLSDKKLNISINHTIVQSGKKIQFKRKEWGAELLVKQCNLVDFIGRIYPDHLSFYYQPEKIKVRNQVYLEHYVAGVVEAESGAYKNGEYYKVQSIICRTYALANLRRHEEEKFHLCDQVHCQVYRGKSRYGKTVITSTQQTKGLILLDASYKLANTSFHSNCGGQTANAEDVWTYEQSHLKSVCDTFCAQSPHSNWEAKISKTEWLFYLQKKMGVQEPDNTKFFSYSYYIPENREAYFLKEDSLRLKQIREDWKFPSAFFSITTEQDTLLFQGKGFGHGVGLCQEGAMNMSEHGYSYEEILKYYYQGVSIVPMSKIHLFW